jgi:hypothetical protein
METRARTVVSPQRFSRRNMFHFLGGAVAAQRLALAMNTKEHACTHERQTNHTATSLRLTFQASAHIMDLDFQDF